MVTDKSSVFNLLLEISDRASIYQANDGNTYADYFLKGVERTVRIKSSEFRSWLMTSLYEKHGKPANSEALQMTINFLEGKAFSEGENRPVFLRTGNHRDNIYLDLGRSDWQVVEITAEGYNVIDYAECPVRFYRTGLMDPLPLPAPGGDINDLWQLVNVGKESRLLVLAWLVFSMLPKGAKPILTFAAPKGSGKSTAARVLKSLVDPSKSPLLPGVGDERNVATAAKGRWLIAYDNLSYLSPEQQNALCCAATGAGFSHRTLHTDMDETYFEYTRPQILTGVDMVPTQSDLLDRCLIVKLDAIAKDRRTTEAQLERRLEQFTPQLLGCLLTLVSKGLGRLPLLPDNIPLPRMADFAKFAIAIWGNKFTEAYQGNIDEAIDEALEANPIARAIAQIFDYPNTLGLNHGVWTGTVTSLCTLLNEQNPNEPAIKKLTPAKLGRKLKGSLKGDLEAAGYSINDRRASMGVMLEITKPDKPPYEPTLPTLPTQPPQGKGYSDVGSDYEPTQSPQPTRQTYTKPHTYTEPTPPEPRQDKGYVGSVGSVGKKPPQSGDVEDFWEDIPPMPDPADFVDDIKSPPHDLLDRIIPTRNEDDIIEELINGSKSMTVKTASEKCLRIALKRMEKNRINSKRQQEIRDMIAKIAGVTEVTW
jgi:hypothetical protein